MGGIGDRETDGYLGGQWCIWGLTGTGRVKQMPWTLKIQISLVHKCILGVRCFGEKPVYMWSLEGWGEIKQGETGEEHAGWRGLTEWMLGTRERGMKKECQGLR